MNDTPLTSKKSKFIKITRALGITALVIPAVDTLISGPILRMR